MIRYVYNDKEELIDNDSSLILGWFIINDTSFFELTKCILTISLADLLYELDSHRNKKKCKFDWYPSDSGEKVVFEKNNEVLKLKYKNKEINFQYIDFYDEIISTSYSLIKDMYKHRINVKNESPFKDLNNLLPSELSI
jgi:hypothetical protein